MQLNLYHHLLHCPRLPVPGIARPGHGASSRRTAEPMGPRGVAPNGARCEKRGGSPTRGRPSPRAFVARSPATRTTAARSRRRLRRATTTRDSPPPPPEGIERLCDGCANSFASSAPVLLAVCVRVSTRTHTRARGGGATVT